MRLPPLPDCQERRLDAGEMLFRTGDPAIGLVVVGRGALELRRVSAEGRVAILHRAGPGETFAEAALFEPHHHCDAVAPVRSLVRICPAASLRRAVQADPGLGWALAGHLAARLVEARAAAERLRLPHAADRLLSVLAALPPDAAGLRHPGRSWKSLAAELGLTHEAAYRALARLERAGTLRREGAGVRLL